jgi:hypothetical protein
VTGGGDGGGPCRGSGAGGVEGTLGIRDGSASWKKRLGLFEKKVDCAFLSWSLGGMAMSPTATEMLGAT